MKDNSDNKSCKDCKRKVLTNKNGVCFSCWMFWRYKKEHDKLLNQWKKSK